MCKKDDRILKPKKGEQMFINAEKIHASDVKTINNFIVFCRKIVEFRKLNNK